MKQRIAALDSIRGIAATVVVFAHLGSMLFYISNRPIAYRFGTFTDVLWDLGLVVADPYGGGLYSVMLFFVLSGFVLALPYLKQRNLTYPNFVLRRVCRIYLPFVVGISFASLLYVVLAVGGFSTGPQGTVDPYGKLQTMAQQDLGYEHFSSRPKLTTVAEAGILTVRQLSMIGTEQFQFMDHPTWSLVHEMRISLFFPLLCLAFLRFGPRPLAAASFAAFLASAVWVYRGGNTGTTIGGMNQTVHYLLFFVMGIWIASLHVRKKILLSRLPAWLRTVLWIAGFAAALPSLVRVSATGAEIFGCLSAGLLISMSLDSVRANKFLETPVVSWLGRVSYSLYLLHAPILYFCFYTLHGRIPVGLILVIYLATTALASEGSYRYVEVPAMALGKRLTSDGIKVASVD